MFRSHAIPFVPLALICLAGLAGCIPEKEPELPWEGDSTPPHDAAWEGDSTRTPDARPVDARTADSATIEDDVGARDAGPPDVAVADAAPVDDAEMAPDGGYEQDPARLNLRGPCPAASHFGGFKVESNDAEGYTAIDGQVRDSIVAGQVLEETIAGGGCALLRRRRLVCDPPCEPGQTCDLGNMCVPAPRGQDMGPVAFQGLVQPVTLDPLQPGNTYFFTRLPHPGFEPDTVVHVSNVPGFVGPLDLYGVGVAPLVTREEVWVLTEGEPLVIHWDAPPDATHTRMYFELNIDQHGLSPASLFCSLPDNGVAEVPVAMTDALIAAGVTGYPTGRMARRTVDSQVFDGRCVDFVVSSVRPIEQIDVTGYLPCTVHEDCPDGPCNLEIQQCE